MSEARIVRRARRAATKWLRDTLRDKGLEVRRRREHYHYAPDYYGRSFAQRTDIREVPVFGPLAAEVVAEGRSCLYYDRLYVIYEALASLRRYAGATRPFRIVEVGVYRGGTSAYLARLAAALGLAGAEVHAFDTFEGHAAVDVDTALDPVHRPGHFTDTSYEAVSAYLARYPNVHVHRGRFEDRCDALAGAPICMMHLDVDLHAPTLHALELCDRQMIDGGVCIVDDYETTSCPGVKAAVQEFLRSHPRYFTVHPHTEQCVLVKLGKGGAP